MLPNQFCTWTSCTAAAPRPHPIDGADHPSPRKAHTPTASVRPHPRQRAQQAELLWPFGRFQVGAGPGCAGPLDGADQLERCGGVRPLRREAVWQRRLSPTERPSTPANAETDAFRAVVLLILLGSRPVVRTGAGRRPIRAVGVRWTHRADVAPWSPYGTQSSSTVTGAPESASGTVTQTAAEGGETIPASSVAVTR